MQTSNSTIKERALPLIFAKALYTELKIMKGIMNMRISFKMKLKVRNILFISCGINLNVRNAIAMVSTNLMGCDDISFNNLCMRVLSC
jgi:hypothetical protein